MRRNKQTFHPCPKATGVSFFLSYICPEANMKPIFRVFLSVSLVAVMGACLVLFLHITLAAADPAQTQSQVIYSGLAYIKSQQEPSGGITGFNGIADPDTTARSVMAVVAARKPMTDMVSLAGNSMSDYLATQAISFTHDLTGTLFPGRAGELLAAVSLAGEDPLTFGGMNLVKELEASFSTDTGAYSTTAQQDYSSGADSDLNQAWAILGLSLAGQSIPDGAVQYLVNSQADDGSWGAGDPDTTALAMTAMLASHKVNVKDDEIQRAIGFFHATQVSTGGWKPSWDTDPLNADSTGWIIQALVSAGEDLRGQSWSTDGTNPVNALMSMQKPDGSIGGTYANAYSTAEAIIGLSGVPLSNLMESPSSYHAGLAVFSGDTILFTGCISFTASSFTGLELLQGSGLPVVTATNPTQGTAVCKIGEIGDDANHCFGSMPNYWSYWSLGDNGWEYSAVGADQSQVVDGGVYAWSWGTGNPPRLITYQNLCDGAVVPMPAATPTSQPTISTIEPSSPATVTPTPYLPVPTDTPVTASQTSGNYVIFTAVVLALGLLVIALIRARRS
jgi:hypothetical protein